MKKYTYLYLMAWLMVISACVEDRDLTYTGPTVVEFSNPVTGYNEKLTGQSIGGGSVYGGNENIPVRGTQDSVVIQLVGPQQSEVIDVNYEIIPGTAVEGEDYEIIGNEGVVTIPANASATAIHFSLLNTSEDPDDIASLTFRITGTSQSSVGVSENYSSFEVSIFPMKAFLNITLGAQGSASASYLSSRDGEVYSAPIGNPSLVDIAYQVSEDGSETPMLVSPSLLGASETDYSWRVFEPTTDIPESLQASYATQELNTISSSSVAAIPTSGSSSASAVHPSVEIVENGIYGFVNSEGDKGYIRIKSISPGIGGAITLDIMSQP